MKIYCHCSRILDVPCEDGLFSCPCGTLDVDNQSYGVTEVIGYEWRISETGKGQPMLDYYAVHNVVMDKPKITKVAARYPRPVKPTSLR